MIVAHRAFGRGAKNIAILHFDVKVPQSNLTPEYNLECGTYPITVLVDVGEQTTNNGWNRI